ncbi:lysozyme inhibitor LprI family protein [Hydrogenovibrio sp. JE_KL2]|uniref:lysozyme inhibitor LprI family protein n=1 Tax=Hydrogenovibrio sp. JE_KL2 TaxID=2651188 RepID=UPI00128E2E14|nr:lysozyme inhibitor LprI family protein [Hydrogenovibrio sp. JE_KL2]MPQ76688.1 DUF1311 domain-containing protein [Hydrogenovibrio sp. JE_KL2]
MKVRKLFLAAPLLMFAAFSVNADMADLMLQQKIKKIEKKLTQQYLPNCSTPRNKYDKVYCSGKLYSMFDDALNKKYSEAQKSLSTAQKSALKKVQLKWIRKRDGQCATVTNKGVMMNLTCAKVRTLESYFYLDLIENNPQNFNQLMKDYSKRASMH